MAFLTTQHWKFIIHFSVECVPRLLDDYSPICTLWLWCKQVLKSHLSIYSDQISAPLSKKDICLMFNACVVYQLCCFFLWWNWKNVKNFCAEKRTLYVQTVSLVCWHPQCNKKSSIMYINGFTLFEVLPIGAVQIIHTHNMQSS